MVGTEEGTAINILKHGENPELFLKKNNWRQERSKQAQR